MSIALIVYPDRNLEMMEYDTIEEFADIIDATTIEHCLSSFKHLQCDDILLWFDEDGAYITDQINLIAGLLAGKPLVGTVVVTGTIIDQDTIADVPTEIVAHVEYVKNFVEESARDYQRGRVG